MEYIGNIYAKIGGKYIKIGHSDEYDTKKYTQEDIIKAIEFGAGGMYGYQIGENGSEVNQIKRFINSLQD